MNPLRGAIVTVAVLIVAAAVGLGAAVALHHRPGGSTSTSTTAAPSDTPGDSSVVTEVVPGPDQAFVTGTITSLSSDNASGAALRPPFTITIPVRGQGNADFTGVDVGGQQVEISWYGGQPLPVSGTGRLDLGGAGLTVTSAGITWMLDGAPRTFTTGSFFLGAPVAVGSSGLATPDQSVHFQAGGESTMVTTGHAQIHLAPANLHITGPGSVTLHGNIHLQTSSGTRTVQSVMFGPGSYDLTVSPSNAGNTINGVLQGTFSAA